MMDHINFIFRDMIDFLQKLYRSSAHYHYPFRKLADFLKNFTLIFVGVNQDGVNVVTNGIRRRRRLINM